MRYREQGENDARWHYRLGYAYVNLKRGEDAEAVLLRGRKLAADDMQTIAWIDELLEENEKNREKAAAKEKAQARRRAAFIARDPNKPYFAGLDLDHFWDDAAWSFANHVGAPATDTMFAEAERALGCKLPESYKQLMRRRNGGVPKYSVFCLPDAAPNETDEIHITGIMGVDPAKKYSVTGSLGSAFMIAQWGYPAIGVAVCTCPSAGHDMIFLDYRNCGPQGEPAVVHIDQEADYEITWLAGDFESFVRGLRLYNEDGETGVASAQEGLSSANADYVKIVEHADSLALCFYIEHDKPLAIGEKMYAIDKNAYMNGYNWEAFFHYYIPKYAPDVAAGLKTDPEAGMYVAYYDLTPENKARAERFVEIIRRLVENEDELYRVIREEGDRIEWD
jgi:hypothetical protein